MQCNIFEHKGIAVHYLFTSLFKERCGFVEHKGHKGKVILVFSLFLAYIIGYNIFSFAREIEKPNPEIINKPVASVGLALDTDKTGKPANSEEENTDNGNSSNAIGNGKGKKGKNDDSIEKANSTQENNDEKDCEKQADTQNSKNTDNAESEKTPEYNLGDTIGYITINSIGIDSVPITFGDEQSLIDNNSICLAHNYALPDYFEGKHPNLLAGHSTKCLKNLPNVTVGDDISVETEYGKMLKYKVSYSKLTKNIDNEQLLDIDSDKPMLELDGSHEVLQIYTCADNIGYGLDYRWFVKAELEKG